MTHDYIIAVGSNMRAHRLGGPRMVIEAAFQALEMRGMDLISTSRTIESEPIGPSLRRYANAVALVRTALPPTQLLKELHRLETAFGRGRNQRRGVRWRSRVLDLDIVLWSGGLWNSAELQIPHPEFRQRRFVLGPAASIAPHWPDPVTGLSLMQLNRRLTRPRTLTR